MLSLDEVVLNNPSRLSSVSRRRTALAAAVVGVDAIAELAAGLLHTPMAAVTLVGRDAEYFAGVHGWPEPVMTSRRLPLGYSVCKYVVSTDHIVSSGDMTASGDPELCGHLLASEYGVRAFLSVPIRDDDDRPVGAVTVFDTEGRSWTGEDTAALLSVERLLRRSEETARGENPVGLVDNAFLPALLDSLHLGVLACDNDGKIVLMNRALREIYGLPGDDLPQGHPAGGEGILFDADQRPLPWHRTPLERARGGEEIDNVDLLVKAPGRRTRIFGVTARPIVGADGRRHGAVAISHEVTAIRRVERFRTCHLHVEQALKSARSVADAAPRVLQATATALGWPAAELFVLDPLTDHLRAAGHWYAGDTDPENFFDHRPIKGLGATGRVWQTGQAVWIPDIGLAAQLRMPYERERADVCLRHGIHTVASVPVYDGEDLVGVLSCYADGFEHQQDMHTVLLDGVAAQVGAFVARHRAEDFARQLARLQGDFVSLVSHEIRTPLTSIVAHAAMLADDDAHLDAESREMIQTVARNAETLQRIVTGLLDLAALESGQVVLDVDPVDLVDVVAAAVAATGHGGMRLDAPPRAVVIGDEPRLRQVVDDLLSNAVNYSPPGAPISIHIEKSAGAVTLSIIDSGIGTPPEERDRLFDRFYRASNVRHQGTPGSGLGLSRARIITQLHGGTIELTDHEPTGTKVCVSLQTAD